MRPRRSAAGFLVQDAWDPLRRTSGSEQRRSQFVLHKHLQGPPFSQPALVRSIMLRCRTGGLALRHLQAAGEGLAACGGAVTAARAHSTTAAAAPAATGGGQVLPSAAAASQHGDERRLASWQLAFAALLGLGGAAASSRAEAAEHPPPPDQDKVWLGTCKAGLLSYALAARSRSHACIPQLPLLAFSPFLTPAGLFAAVAGPAAPHLFQVREAHP